MQADFRPFLLLCWCRSIPFSEVADLFNVVHQAVKHPLDIDFDLSPQGEPVHPLARADVAENRFYNAQPFAVSAASLFGVDLLLHLIGNAARTPTVKYPDLSCGTSR